MAYVGNHTVYWMADRDINAAAPGTGNVGRPLYAKYGRNITTICGTASPTATTTACRLPSIAAEDGCAGMRYFNWEPAFRRNRTAAGYDRRHMFTMAFVWDIPAGKGKKLTQCARQLANR